MDTKLEYNLRINFQKAKIGKEAKNVLRWRVKKAPKLIMNFAHLFFFFFSYKSLSPYNHHQEFLLRNLSSINFLPPPPTIPKLFLLHFSFHEWGIEPSICIIGIFIHQTMFRFTILISISVIGNDRH